MTPEPEFPESTLPTDSIEEEGVHSSTTTDSSIVTTWTIRNNQFFWKEYWFVKYGTANDVVYQWRTKEEPKQPVEKSEAIPKENKPIVPAKEVTVSVTPSGEITTNTSQGMSVPIVTSNVEELTHIPTPTTPLKVAGDQTIVGVKDGIPLIQDSEGIW